MNKQMTDLELIQAIIGDKVKVDVIHPLHKAIFDELVEHLRAKEDELTTKELINAGQIAFVTNLSILKGIIKGSLQIGDQATINYRGQQFIINSSSPLLD